MGGCCMSKKKLKPEFVACLQKCIDDHSTSRTDELDRKQILKRSVRELERRKNGAEVSECDWAFFKGSPDDKEFSSCIILKIKVDVMSFWVVAMPDDFTER